MDCLTSIRHARELKFELIEMLGLASLTDNPGMPCQRIIGRHLQTVERRFASCSR